MTKKRRAAKPPSPAPLHIDLPDEDREAFLRAMRGVRRLTGDERPPPSHNPSRRPASRPRTPRRDPMLQAAEAFATAGAGQRRAPHPDFAPSHANPDGRRLKREVDRGRLHPALKLDLHGATVMQAESRLSRFVERATRTGERCVIIVHGKGYNSPNGLPVLRPAVQAWLTRHPQVVSHTLASDRHGGSGASYALLRC